MIATLLFQPMFIRKMIEVGERDGLARLPEIAAFLGLTPAANATAPRAARAAAAMAASPSPVLPFPPPVPAAA